MALTRNKNYKKNILTYLLLLYKWDEYDSARFIFGEARKCKSTFFFDNSKAQNEFGLFYLSSGIKAQN